MNITDIVALLFFVLLCALIALGSSEGADDKEKETRRD